MAITIARQKGRGRLTADTNMKLNEIPINTLVELQFEYLGEKHMVSAGLLYKYSESVYVSAVKNAGETIPAKRLKNLCLVYKTDAGVYTFSHLSPRSISYNGQNLYAVQTDQEAQPVNHRNAYRLFVGVPVSAKIIAKETSRYMNCILKDISMTGMGILSLNKIDELAKIVISFRVNDSARETLTGNIIHSYELKNGKGFLYGCEFDEPNEIIGKYVARQQAEMELIHQG